MSEYEKNPPEEEIPKEQIITAEKFNQGLEYLNRGGTVWSMRLAEAIATEPEDMESWTLEYEPKKDDPNPRETTGRIKTILAMKQNIEKGDERVKGVLESSYRFVDKLKKGLQKRIDSSRIKLQKTRLVSEKSELNKKISIYGKKIEDLVYVQSKLTFAMQDHENYQDILKQVEEEASDYEEATQESIDELFKD